MVYFCPFVKCSFSCHAAEQKRTSFKAQAECIPSRHPSTAREIETRFNGNVKNEISISYGMMHGTRRRITTALCALSASLGVFVHEQLWAAAAPKRRAKNVNKSLRHTWTNQTHRHIHTHTKPFRLHTNDESQQKRNRRRTGTEMSAGVKRRKWTGAKFIAGHKYVFILHKFAHTHTRLHIWHIATGCARGGDPCKVRGVRFLCRLLFYSAKRLQSTCPRLSGRASASIWSDDLDGSCACTTSVAVALNLSDGVVNFYIASQYGSPPDNV